MTDRDRVRQLLFSSNKTVLRIQSNPDNKIKVDKLYRITRNKEHTLSFFVWGRDMKTDSTMEYIGLITPTNSTVRTSDKSDKDRVFATFMMVLFDEYPWVKNMGVEMSSECSCCGHITQFTKNMV